MLGAWGGWCAPPPEFFSATSLQRGKIPHFFFSFENRRQHGLAARDLTEKLVKTGGTPFLSTFWSFWAKGVHTGEFLEHPWSARY